MTWTFNLNLLFAAKATFVLLAGLLILLDGLEWSLRKYTLHHWPIGALPHTMEGRSSEVLYGGRIAHTVLQAIAIVRSRTPFKTSIIPIPSPPPLFQLLPSYDFIVVGAGTAGSVAAGRLMDSGMARSVLLLEAGEPPVNGLLSSELLPVAAILRAGSAVDWAFRTTPQQHACQGHPDRASFWTRGKGLGGTSVLNFMLSHKGHPNDYDLWALCLNDTTWGASSLGKVMQSLETAQTPNEKQSVFPRGRKGPMPMSLMDPQTDLTSAFLKAAAEMSMPNATYYNAGINSIGAAPIELVKWRGQGQRVSSYRAFAEPHLKASKEDSVLHVVPYAMVTRLHLQQEATKGGLANRVVGVEFTSVPSRAAADLSIDEKSLLERQTVNVTKEVILSSGAIGTPHILMLSGIGPKDHLRSECKIDLPGVGSHLLDHILHPLMVHIRPSFEKSLYSIRNALNPFTLYNYFTKGKGMLSSPGCNSHIILPNMGTMKRSLPSFCDHLSNVQSIEAAQTLLRNTPDVHLLLYEGSPDLIDLQNIFNVPLDITKKMGHSRDWNENSNGRNLPLALMLPVLLNPESKGSIKLQSFNPFEPPIIDPHYLSNPRDVEVILYGLRIAQQLSQTAAWSRVSDYYLEPKEGTSDETWKKMIRYMTLPLYHPGGTCRMGLDSEACVDTKLKVKGTQNLRLADASILPTLPSGPPQMLIMTLGEMVVHFILDDMLIAH